MQPLLFITLEISLLIEIFLAAMVVITLYYLHKNRKQNKKLQTDIFIIKNTSSRVNVAYEELLEKFKSLENQKNELSNLLSLQLAEQSTLKEELKRAVQTAEEADMLKSNFLANMSHEIRTPMNGILGFAQLMQSEEMDRDKHDRYLDIICHNGTMLVNLIDDIMDISKIEAGQLALSKVKVNLDNLMFDLYTFFNEIKFKQEKEHITIRLLNLNDDENSVFYSDEQRIRQILSNLIGNALKFTEKGFVEFGYINDVNERSIKFFVRDTGIGIPPEKLDIIFERFRQVQEGSTRRYGGTGIGLYISKHIVDLMGGKLWVESKLNVGTIFNFTLPYESMKEHTDNTKVFQPINKEYDWSRKVILVAEDVETNYHFLNAVLAKTNAKLIWASDGEEAVQLCAGNDQVDVVLMDVQMPKLNGYEAASQIKQHNPNIRIIAQTAYAMPNDNIKCIEAGCDDYISKPINTGLLLEKIDYQLQGLFKFHQ
ncbi:MAG TPA: ATP-binding protein [Tenuifilaceae bacterium]|nr:ATP-binding protein [Tenuifilaceae bacterium]HPE18291.1 ATP-binding protein [Tenuifilaceae bacterium]HPJ46867.1 ATP-binding protein [Tenuifilaceae bacterium]HPQ34614.1 ATP-binding protein [Tenuifilaceae bacterium]HRX68950.1 ATP-binding protein [Tenuifilaceae bacterium]